MRGETTRYGGDLKALRVTPLRFVRILSERRVCTARLAGLTADRRISAASVAAPQSDGLTFLRSMYNHRSWPSRRFATPRPPTARRSATSSMGVGLTAASCCVDVLSLHVELEWRIDAQCDASSTSRIARSIAIGAGYGTSVAGFGLSDRCGRAIAAEALVKRPGAVSRPWARPSQAACVDRLSARRHDSASATASLPIATRASDADRAYGTRVGAAAPGAAEFERDSTRCWRTPNADVRLSE